MAAGEGAVAGMSSKLREELFARLCARLGEPLEAARLVGLNEEEALRLALKSRVRAKIEQLEKELEARARGDAVRTLQRLAAHNGLDGVKLALHAESLTPGELERLDLAGVASFKYTPQGVCEVKFFDPCRAAGLLLEADTEQKDGAEAFDKALRESAEAIDN